MLTVNQILEKLDNFELGCYCQFIDLGHPYYYLIDARLNVFVGENDQWAIVAEKLGYNPRADNIILDICYYGNCLTNLESYNEQDINYYSVYPVDQDSWYKANDGEDLKEDAEYWTVRGSKVLLSHDLDEYRRSDITIDDYDSDCIPIICAARLAITKYREQFRATDLELQKSLPAGLKKILVIDEWYHKSYTQIVQPTVSDEHLKYTFDINQVLKEQLDEETFTALFRKQEESNAEFNQIQYEDNRPSTYETWQLLARVIQMKDSSYYKPTLTPNTHWKNWPESGSL